jgi:threonine synthase
MSQFIDDINDDDLQAIINKSYQSFNHPDITPLVQHGNLHILELFHGPTLAFKDVALQFLGNLFAYLLKRDQQVLNIIGATSGDTGSAAIYGVRGKKRINIFILHPHQRVSLVQEKQMTAVIDDNVFNIAIKGTFDDGQAIVKGIFNDIDFKSRFHLGAINSINWARVLAQVVYYIKAVLSISTATPNGIDFAVPTGNFGDIFAGFIAKQMLPAGAINRLILATNANDILARFVSTAKYSLGKVIATSSPSMDIQSASNFERYLYYLLGQNAPQTKEKMEEFARTGSLELQPYKMQIADDFIATVASETAVFATIANFYQQYGYTLDPHTAVGVYAATTVERQDDRPIICLATAHPAKFGDIVEQATEKKMVLPDSIAAILKAPSRCQLMNADINEIKDYIKQHAV